MFSGFLREEEISAPILFPLNINTDIYNARAPEKNSGVSHIVFFKKKRVDIPHDESGDFMSDKEEYRRTCL